MEYVEKLAQHARDMDKPWPPQAKNTVRRLGERLSQVIWKGRQWAVTTYGLEERAGLYHVQRNRLWKGEDDYGWVRTCLRKDGSTLPISPRRCASLGACIRRSVAVKRRTVLN
jgi:hypothetical protein